MKQNVNKTAICRTIFIAIIFLVLSGNILSQNNSEGKIFKSSINQLIVKGNITVYIVQDIEQKIYFRGNNKTLKQIKTSVKNNVLTLSKGYSLNNERVTVFLTIDNLKSIKTSGDVIIETPTNIWLNKLSLDLSEETEALFFINSNQLDLTVSGSGFLNISGYIDTLIITGTEDAEIDGNIKSYKLSCTTSNFCNITLKGTVFKSFLSASNLSSIDLTNCEVGKSLIVAYNNSKVKVNSSDLTDIWAFNKSSVSYKSANQATISESTKVSQIKKNSYKIYAKK
ncbi:MAG: hypothetical protein A2X08_18005 [Bacteroidetes bacterium GWA2_32_17]|nr:MAG: hypothetical protein A2X08_18005 [Bacteroidetes bacterium GWA2_32_17]